MTSINHRTASKESYKKCYGYVMWEIYSIYGQFSECVLIMVVCQGNPCHSSVLNYGPKRDDRRTDG